MKTLTVNIEDDLSEKAIVAVLDALKLGYEIQCRLLKDKPDRGIRSVEKKPSVNAVP